MRFNWERWAVDYLQRWPASTAWFKDALARAKKRREMKGKSIPEVDVDKLVDTMTRAGLLDDEAYGRALYRSLSNSGKSKRAIQQKLRHKGVPEAIRDRLLNARESSEDLEAAKRVVERKRLGRDPERKQKDLAALARRGFSYDVAKRALSGD